MTVRGWRWLGAVLVTAALAVACGAQEPAAQEPATTGAPDTGAPDTGGGSATLRLYTTVSQAPVDAVLAAFREARADVQVELFRAPTGELNARLAAERREGGVQADVLWLSDPLSMQGYADEGLLQRLDAPDVVPEEFRTGEFAATHLLEVVIVHQPGLDPAPTAWEDLADPAYAGGVAIPDPGFAGSALGALGYFAQADGFGLDYYRALADNGTVQVQAPGEVVTGVAEGRFLAGMTLSFAAREAIEDGSPLRMVRPEPGAIAVYSPVAIVAATGEADAAEAFVEFLLTAEAQALLAEAGGYEPIRDDVAGPGDQGGGDRRVAPDWPAIFDDRDELLTEYRTIFGG